MMEFNSKCYLEGKSMNVFATTTSFQNKTNQDEIVGRDIRRKFEVQKHGWEIQRWKTLTMQDELIDELDRTKSNEFGIQG